jgi:protein-S-isoprenylcysteine O-methyltransferase Ste14
MPGPSKSDATTPMPAGGRLKALFKLLVTALFWWAAAFVAAGRFGWVRGWIWVATAAAGMVAGGLLVHRENPGLMAARARIRRADTKRFGKVFLALYFPLLLLQPVVAGLDAVRFGWSSMPPATVYAGLVLVVLGATPVTWALMENPYAETSVRIQSDRGQKVVTSGPYRLVRHPMYLGALLMYPGVALILGSVWALAIAGLIAILMVGRTALEDRTLRRELPGYEGFVSVTRYRLIPGVW